MTDDKKRKAEEAAADKQQLQERILRGVRPDTSEATGKWVVDLKSGADAGKIEVPLQFDEKTAGKFPDDMRSWVDKMFDEFQRYLVEYNKFQRDPDMLIHSERPDFVKATVQGSTKYRNNQQAPAYFQGHLYSTHWALLIRGEELAVKGWIVPVDYLIGFDTREEDFAPFFTMKAANNSKGICIWHVDAVPISYEAINAISKALFSALVRATRDEFKEGEQFRLAAEEVQEASKMDTEQFIQRYTIPPGSLNAQFLHQAQPPALPPVAPQQAMQGSPQSPYPGFSSPMQSAQLPQIPSLQQPQAPYQAPPQQPSPQPPQPPFQQPPQPPFQQPQQPPQPQPSPFQQLQPPLPAPASQNVSFSQPAADPSHQDMLFQALEENYKAVVTASQTASHTLTTQMDMLNKIGVAAMHAQNMEAVMQVMRRTNSLRLFRDKIDGFIEELDAIKSSK